MTLDADTCYGALKARDSRFDGRFFTGVKTTGIYCRPICPAVTPLRRNVEFFACAAAAQQAGYRPCKRCRPEASPGTSAWRGTSATVSRALRLIGDGALDRGTVGQLAERLGVSARQLGRLFRTHLGASPVAVAQTRRAHFARNLLAETELPVAQVALAAGFGSLRRFNALMRRVFRQTPTELRACAASRRLGSSFAARLPFRPPLDLGRMLRFLARRAIPGVEEVVEGVYRRTVVWAGEAGVVAVRSGANDHLVLEADLPRPEGLITLVSRVRRMFDCDAEPHTIAARLGQDPLLEAAVQQHPGLRLPSAWDPFELGVRAIVGQQVSVGAATTVAGRIVRRSGQQLALASGGLTHLFPTPAALAEADLAGVGMPGRRVASVQTFARAVAEGRLELAAPRGPDELVRRLVALPGVGAWTAEYIAMRAFGEPDAFPASDLGLRKAAPGVDLEARAERWRPWRAYAALYLWAKLEGESR